MITINDIYLYVLQPIKAIKMPTEDELQSIAAQSSKPIEDIKASKIKQIKQHQTKITEIFTPYRANPKLRAFLRISGAHQLEDLLFNEHNSPLTSLLSPIQEEAIAQAFREHNERYHYFSQKDLERFKLFFKTCQFIADVVENNNSADNSVAFLHAYKLMVLFKEGTPKRPFDLVDTFLSLHAQTLGQYSTPIHDLLVYDIPCLVEPMPPQDLQQWRILIHAGGPKAIKLFQRAEAINKRLYRAPCSLDEAQAIAAELTYPRASENPELASLCLQHDLSEDHFNRCLEVERSRKTRDNLPPCRLDGKTVGHPGYFLVKLPIPDLRAYVLGHITNCCQSIGGHSELCVVDGVTRENCGFYVLLKGPEDGHPITSGDQINNAEFRIVGQGYAWLSNNYSLVFDSWENLRPEDDVVIDLILRRFAEQLTSQQDSSIVAVSIGTGGKTPQTLAKDNRGQPLKVIRETMKEGVPYSDSANQWALAFNAGLFERLRQTVADDLQATIDRGFTGLESMLKCLAQNPTDIGIESIIYPSCELIKLINQLFLQEDSLAFWGKVLKNDSTKLSVFAEKPSKTISLCQIFVFLKNLGLLTDDKASDNFEVIAQDKYRLVEILLLLQQEKLLTGKHAKANFETIIKRRRYRSLDVLFDAQQNHLLTREYAQAHFEAIVNHPNSNNLLDAIHTAKRNDLLIGEHAQAYFSAIVNHQNPRCLVGALSAAKGDSLLTGEHAQSNREAILCHQNPRSLAEALSAAKRNNLLSGEHAQAHFDAMVNHQNPEYLVAALSIAERCQLLTGGGSQANFDAITNHENLVVITKALSFAQKNGLLTGPKRQANFAVIINHKEASDLVEKLKQCPKQETLDEEAVVCSQTAGPIFFKPTTQGRDKGTSSSPTPPKHIP